jgi:kumamolisin
MNTSNFDTRIGKFSSYHHVGVRRGKGQFRNRAWGVHNGFQVEDVLSMYGYNGLVTGLNTTIALLQLGGGYQLSDMNPQLASRITSVGVLGIGNNPTGDPNGPDGEVGLDLQVAGKVAKGASIRCYFGQNTEEGFISIVDAVNEDKSQFNIKSLGISWGGPEDTWSPAGREALRKSIQNLVDKGVIVTAAAGDNGSSDGEGSASNLHVDLPSCLDNVLAVGGTRIELSNGMMKETVWGGNNRNGATGGGQSIFIPVPTFQSGSFLTLANQTTVPLSGRGVPDVACLADPETGFVITIDGEQMVIGGTSAGAPFWAGIAALIAEARDKSIFMPQFNASLFGMGSKFKLPLTNDTIQGTNGEYIASTGWDACTGLGSPRIQNILSAYSQ